MSTPSHIPGAGSDAGLVRGMVFNIQRYSIHDGPGVRTTVFLKGCPLRCRWCHNPESIDPRPQILRYPAKCIGCGGCRRACPLSSGYPEGEWAAGTVPGCLRCGRCAEACHAEALAPRGKEMAVDEVMAVVDRDAPYYAQSGGGATFSGGEPLRQPDFLRALLLSCRERGYHATVDTSGHVPWANFQKALGLVSLWLFDIKAIDPVRHLEMTGSDNGLILDNLRRLQADEAPIILRVPVVPGVNDAPADIEGLADIARRHPNVRRVDLLALNHLATAKYEGLGADYPMAGRPEPARRAMEAMAEALRASGVDAQASGGKNASNTPSDPG